MENKFMFLMANMCPLYKSVMKSRHTNYDFFKFWVSIILDEQFMTEIYVRQLIIKKQHNFTSSICLINKNSFYGFSNDNLNKLLDNENYQTELLTRVVKNKKLNFNNLNYEYIELKKIEPISIFRIFKTDPNEDTKIKRIENIEKYKSIDIEPVGYYKFKTNKIYSNYASIYAFKDCLNFMNEPITDQLYYVYKTSIVENIEIREHYKDCIINTIEPTQKTNKTKKNKNKKKKKKKNIDTELIYTDTSDNEIYTSDISEQYISDTDTDNSNTDTDNYISEQDISEQDISDTDTDNSNNDTDTINPLVLLTAEQIPLNFKFKITKHIINTDLIIHMIITAYQKQGQFYELIKDYTTLIITKDIHKTKYEQFNHFNIVMRDCNRINSSTFHIYLNEQNNINYFTEVIKTYD